MSDKIDIYTATHKKVELDLPSGYSLMEVNAAKRGEHWPGYLYDDTGENISEKNESYCELTVLYSLWKNSTADIKGLAHYRRYLSKDSHTGYHFYKLVSERKLKQDVMDLETAEKILEQYEIILPLPYLPSVSTVRQNREEFCYERDLKNLDQVIDQFFPDYSSDYSKVMDSCHMSCWNMMIAKREIFDSYCEWLFDVLYRVESICDISQYDTQHKRLYGYLSEVLLNVYVRHQGLRVCYTNACSSVEMLGYKKRALLTYSLWERPGFQSIMKLASRDRYRDHMAMHDRCVEFLKDKKKGA